MKTPSHIRELINRLARLDATSVWQEGLNPTQQAVLEYLSRANRFSRSPSHVAEYLGTTRGTVSQTFKALVQKGYVSEHRSETDKRAILFNLTDKGERAAEAKSLLNGALAELDPEVASALNEQLTQTLQRLLARNGGRSFGLCQSCKHHQITKDGAFCHLLTVALTPEEAEQICHEQETA